MIRPTVDAVAVATGLPKAVVRRLAQVKGGAQPHGDVSDCGLGCMWCSTLRWIYSNPDQARQEASQIEDAVRLDREHQKIMSSEQWKREHADVWDFLDDVAPGDFKKSVVKAVESGSVSNKMEEALIDMVKRKKSSPPEIGTSVQRLHGTVERVEVVTDPRRGTVARVSLKTEDGWTARVDCTEPYEISTWSGAVYGVAVTLSGRVVWRSDRMAILDGKLEQT